MTNYLELAAEVGQIARAAGAEIMKIYETEDFGVEMKSDDSPLTKADKAANDVIVAGLEALTFQAPIVSEESGSHDYATRSQYTRHWLVDPLDGTKEFIKRNGDFTVNIALIENGRPVLGVVYVPVKNELFYSAPGEGAYEVTTEGGIMELARGNAHLYPRLAPTMEWDTAAAHAILLEAGGKMVDDGTGKEMRYNKENLLNPYFIGYGKVQEELLGC